MWHKRVGHPPEQVMRSVQNITGSGVNLEGTLISCDSCMMNECTQQNDPKTTDSDNITDHLQLVSTDILGPVTPIAIGGVRYMAKLTDYFNRLRIIYCFKSKDEALTTPRNFIQDLEIPLGLRFQRLRADRGGEYTADCFRRYL